jgi:lysophospholipase L1-like esterase
MKKKSKKRSAPEIKTQSDPYPRWKRVMFFCIMLLIPVILIVLIETGLMIFHLFPPVRLFIPTPYESSEYFGINTSIGERYFTKRTFSPTPRKDLFLRQKPENGFRIFVLGGSTTAGFPYGNNLTFTRILNRRLSDTFPDKRIEVVNMAMTAINTYTLLDFMDDLLKKKPDALLIYAGHNEFYGALGAGSVESAGRYAWIVHLYLKMQRFRTFNMLRDVLRQIGRSKIPVTDDTDPMATIMSRIVKNKEIPVGSRLYQATMHQFHQNLNGIIKKSIQAGVPVLISELVCNLRDQPPFIATQDGTPTEAAKTFVRARKLERENRYAEARSSYEKAKDLDLLRFRAPEDFNQIIHETASDYQIPVIPMKSIFTAASPRGLIGNSLICDHLHPNKNGYFLMADAFYRALRHEKLIRTDWPADVKSSETYFNQWGFTRLDSTYAALTIDHLKGGWPFKKTGPNRALEQIRYRTPEDSIVLKIITTGQTTLEMGHIELARKFERTGKIDRAVAEYKALIYSVPNLDLFYEPVVNLLVSKNQYQKALQLLQDGLHFNTSFFMLKWVGQLHLALQHTEAGIEFLERACQLNADDELVLYNLARAYYQTGQPYKGESVYNRLKTAVPNSSLIENLNTLRRPGSPTE